jgi:hypothetical protein
MGNTCRRIAEYRRIRSATHQGLRNRHRSLWSLLRFAEPAQKTVERYLGDLTPAFLAVFKVLLDPLRPRHHRACPVRRPTSCLESDEWDGVCPPRRSPRSGQRRLSIGQCLSKKRRGQVGHAGKKKKTPRLPTHCLVVRATPRGRQMLMYFQPRL